MLALIANWKRILYGTALALLGALLLVQTVRIDGFLFIDGLKAENTELRETLAKVEAAQKLATEHAKAERARIEAENERKAENAKADYQKRIADNRAIIDRWLRSQAGRSTGNTNLPEASEATERASGTDPAPVLFDTVEIPASDLPKIAEAFAKLEALQAFHKALQETR